MSNDTVSYSHVLHYINYCYIWICSWLLYEKERVKYWFLDWNYEIRGWTTLSEMTVCEGDASLTCCKPKNKKEEMRLLGFLSFCATPLILFGNLFMVVIR